MEVTKSFGEFRGMLVYKEEMSNLTIKVPGGSGGSLLSLLKKSAVSRIYDGSERASGCKKQCTKLKIFSVGAPFEDTIGLPGLPGL